MVLFNEYDTDRLDDIIEELNKYFYLIDKDFFLEFDSLREEISSKYNEMKDDRTFRLEGKLAGKYIPFEESVRIAGDVFASINPRYKDMFLTLIKDPKYKIHYKEEHCISFNDDIYLKGTIDDVLVLVHEFAHNFVIKEDSCFFFNLFSEVNAMFWEKVAADYLASEYNTFVNYDRVRIAELINNRNTGIKKTYMDLIANSKKGIDQEGYFKLYKKTNPLARLFINSDMFLSRYGIQFNFFSNYWHDLGYLVSNSMYQDYLDNPRCISKLYDIERINSFSDDLLKEGLAILYEDDIPITHDGKVSLKGGNSNRLLSSLRETMKRERVKSVVE